MNSSSKLAVYALLFIGFLLLLSRLFNQVGNQKNWSFIYQENILGVKTTNKQLESIITHALNNQDNGRYAIVIQSLNDPQSAYLLNEQEIFPAASLYKLFLVAAAFQEIENNNLKSDQKISSSINHLKQVAGEEFGYEDKSGDIEYTVTQLLDRVTRISDNYASIMLAEQIGWEKVQQQANLIGTKNTKIKSPISTTAEDIALFYQKLYKKQIVSYSASDQIIELLSKAQINDRIPANLPKQIELKEGTSSAKLVALNIAHKTGELSRIRHDAGIVFLPNNPYIIVLMSKDLTYEDQVITLMADLSKDIYNYFSQNHLD